MQYNLWYLLLGLLAVPFIPFYPIGFPEIFSWIGNLKNFPTQNAKIIIEQLTSTNLTGTSNWMNDFTVSVSSNVPSVTGLILFGIWITGMLAMIIFLINTSFRLITLKKSALPLQNPEVRRLYGTCLEEANIEKDIPLYSSAFLRSPIIVGLLKPCIYLPIHLISDYIASDMRYMLLHELQHYRYKDAIANYLMNLAGVLYWFNPLIWHALREMRSDREIACDTSVLKMLPKDSYEDYGNTLINFVEKVSLTPFPFTVGLGGNIKQMKRRIINIASYEKATFRERLTSITTFILTAVLLLGLAPILSTYAIDNDHYQWNTSSKNISYTNLSAYFEKYQGSFVLYNLENDAWNIHDMEHATLRVAPNSTYKVYSALFGLQESIIKPDDSLIMWNKDSYPFKAWNADHNLKSAMESSVNWYFQNINQQLGSTSVYHYIQDIGYGNKNISADFSSYWMESSLKISPVEQVELLTRLYRNDFNYAQENINTLKDAIYLSSSETGTLYGKTGTGQIDGQDVNGWFIGYIETTDNAYFFATNISADTHAAGSNATEITMAILSDMKIWK